MSLITHCYHEFNSCRSFYRRVMAYAWFVACIVNQRLGYIEILMFYIHVTDNYLASRILGSMGRHLSGGVKMLDSLIKSDDVNVDDAFVLLASICFRIYIDVTIVKYIWDVLHNNAKSNCSLDFLAFAGLFDL